MNQTRVSIEPEGDHVQRPLSAAKISIINAITSNNPRRHSSTGGQGSDDLRTNGNKSSAPKFCDNQHQCDEQTFRQRVNAVLWTRKMATDQQRAQLIELMFKHNDLWIARQLENLGYEYGSTRVCVGNHGVNKSPAQLQNQSCSRGSTKLNGFVIFSNFDYENG